MSKKIGMVSLGCPKNLVDSELMLGKLKSEGFEIVNDADAADIIVINTCGFIESAKQESINTILEMAALKERNCELLVVAGCMAERYRREILDEIPEVDVVLGTGSYHEIAEAIREAYGGKRVSRHGKTADVSYLDGERVVSTGKGYAYLKIAEGCDNHCTYCIIPSLRGPYRSRKMESITEEARRLADTGIKELIVTAQDTTRYGLDLYGKKMLAELIRNLSMIEPIQWIRLLYCYPEEIDLSLLKEIASNDKVCKYIDIPIQHASPPILRRMGRRGSISDICRLIDTIRKEIPDAVIRTTVITGFPGETEEDFEALAGFIENYRFDRLGTFMYSKEEGTAAYDMPDQVPQKVKRSRYNRLMKIQKRISAELNRQRLGKVYKVLVEGVADDGIFYYGRSYAEAPEIDGLIYFTSEEPLEINSFVNVRILDAGEYDLTGEAQHESSE
ncbi:MAG TPA: 30S ribosomal protein S12 methylthiotransferase RimO [Clostridiales bacterium]|nr:30S ribosomal protein S12 methylthiotransferase RimO [Clostridiales bacterium]HPV02860.1 30S ribosomal protein S12 methylthiotransferase RimO [Clostridiales bacterium]